MAHDHAGHPHAHAHDHAPADYGRAFAIGTALNMGFVLAELGFGFAANSLALIADAAHNFADVIGLLLAWGGSWLTKRKPSERRTFGFRPASILAALANAVLLLVAVGAIGVESIRRFWTPAPLETSIVMWVALVGIAINTATAMLFMRGRASDINIQGAFLHMAADAAVSLGVVIAAVLIMLTGWLWLDPVVSLVIAAVILVSSYGLARDSIDLALAAAPRAIDMAAVRAYLGGLPGVTEVHDLHVWAMSTTETALTAHLVRPGAGLDDRLLADACHVLGKEFGIRHVTLQVEAGDPAHPCRQAADGG